VALVQSRISRYEVVPTWRHLHRREHAGQSSHTMAQPPGKLMDVIRRPVSAASSLHQSAANHLQPLVTLAQRNGVSRRYLLTLLASAAAIPEASESRKALLQGNVSIWSDFPGLCGN
jgi:hypothetical protein